ncbi:MAG: hypothetical protein L6433_12905 [Actinomycetia bacterium]|nr:hypothetical protein [Actinomycetes bacterium]
MTPRIQVLTSGQGDLSYTSAGDATDIAMQVSTVSPEEINLWDKQRIVDSIIREAQAAPDLAREIADEVEKTMVATGQTRITTSLIRELVDLQLMERGLSHMLEKHTKLGLPMFDVENIISQPNKENSNTTHNPESINLTIAETVLKQYALQRIFSDDIARAHYEGDIHLHDLGFCVRPYCGGHSLEYVKKFGLRLPNITSTSSPARHPDVLIGHMVKMASTLQSYYAGAIGWEAVNVFFAPFLVGLPYKRIRQLAEMLIFEFNQLAGARGSLRRDERVFIYDKQENQVKLVEIGEFADSFIQREGEATAPVEDDRYYAFSFDHDTGQTCLSRIYAAIRHENNHRIVNLKTSQGQNVKVTDNHSLFKFDEDGRIVKAQPKENPDVVLVPNSIGINLGREEIDVLALLDRREVALEDGRVFVVEKAKSRLGVDRFLNITPELTRLIGYYVAEGSLGSQVQLAIFHEQTARDVEDCVRAVFGVPCHHRDGSCFFGGKTHVALFEALCGKRAENKRIPAEILLGDGEGAVEFLSAYLSGDGWVAGNRIGCSTVSDTLASHVWLMFSRLGCMPSMRKEEIETGLEIKGVAVAETKTRHVITIGKMAMDKVKFVHREKEGKRLAAIRKSGKRYDQKGYSYHHIREQVKTVFGDRISVKALNKVSPQMIEELRAEVSRRLSTVDIELLKNLHDEDFVGICKEYVLGNKELCYSTSYGLLRQLERGEVPVHSTHIRTDEVLKGTCYEQVEMKGVIDALSIPRAIDSGSGINRSHSFFD